MKRPYPPLNFIDSDNWQPYTRLIPAKEVHEWINRQVLSDTGSIHNPDHEHLLDADLCFMWASASFAKKGRYVLGQAEQVMLRAGGWQKARMEQQMHEWFGRIPKFIITLAADYCSQCSDLEFCALVEHELYHIAQATTLMISAHLSSTKRPGSQCLHCAATTSKSLLVLYVDTVPAKKYRSSLMRPMRQQKWLTSI